LFFPLSDTKQNVVHFESRLAAVAILDDQKLHGNFNGIFVNVNQNQQRVKDRKPKNMTPPIFSFIQILIARIRANIRELFTGFRQIETAIIDCGC